MPPAFAIAVSASLLRCSSAHPASQAAPAPAEAGADGSSGFTYAPAGCAYTLTPPASRGFTDLALDDATQPSDAASAAPLRVRLGLGGGTTKGAAGYADPTTTAAFTWETAKPTTNAKVRIGPASSTLADVHTGYVFTAPTPTTGFGDTDAPAYLHEVHVCGLTPGTTYDYQVGGGAPGSEIWSAMQSFTTVPASDVTVAVLGDARDHADTWQLVNQRLRDAGVNLMLFGGDLVTFGTSEALLAQWLDAIWKDPQDATKFLTLGQTMLVPIAGNHEAESTEFYGAFAIPGDSEQAASFDVASAHFVLLDDSPIAVDPTTPESKGLLAWLDGDLALADADRAARPFVVVIDHRSLFSTSFDGQDPDVLAARGALAPLFDVHHVDLVINGHDHEYERSKPVTAGSPASGPPVIASAAGTGTTYVVTAGAGADGTATNLNPASYSLTATAFGAGTPYLGCYTLLSLSTGKLTMTSYGLKASGGSVQGDTVIDSLALTK